MYEHFRFALLVTLVGSLPVSGIMLLFGVCLYRAATGQGRVASSSCSFYWFAPTLTYYRFLLVLAHFVGGFLRSCCYCHTLALAFEEGSEKAT